MQMKSPHGCNQLIFVIFVTNTPTHSPCFFLSLQGEICSPWAQHFTASCTERRKMEVNHRVEPFLIKHKHSSLCNSFVQAFTLAGRQACIYWIFICINTHTHNVSVSTSQAHCFPLAQSLQHLTQKIERKKKYPSQIYTNVFVYVIICKNKKMECHSKKHDLFTANKYNPKAGLTFFHLTTNRRRINFHIGLSHNYYSLKHEGFCSLLTVL